jgi:hypothetical protein
VRGRGIYVPLIHTSAPESRGVRGVVRTGRLSGQGPIVSAPPRASHQRTVNDKTEWGAGEELNAESLAEAWRAFAAEKFQATDREKHRPDLPLLSPAGSREKEDALAVLRKMKAPGIDGMPVEIYQASPVQLYAGTCCSSSSTVSGCTS